MGTKVQCKSYLPGYYLTRDLKTDASNSWPFCCEDRTLNAMFCSGFTSSPANGHREYDKEVLKQTMLRHEEIFRKQVYELHRVYKIQRDLMNELRTKNNFSAQVQSCQSSMFSTRMLPEDRENSWEGHAFPSVSASCSRTTVSGIDDAQTNLSFLSASRHQSSLLSRENGGSQGINELVDPNIGKFPRRVFDLGLPADAYIDNEDTEHAEEETFVKPLSGTADPSSGNCRICHENDVKLTLDTAQSHGSRDGTQKSSSFLEKGLSHHHNLFDLNVPPKEEICEEMVVSSCKFAVQTTLCELLGHPNSMNLDPHSPGFQKDFFHDGYKGGEGSAFLPLDTGEKVWQCPLLKDKIGQSSNHVNSFISNISNKEVRWSSEHLQIQPKDAQEFPSILSVRQNETESWFSGNLSQTSELSDSFHMDNAQHSESMFPILLGPLSTLPLAGSGKTASSLFSNSIGHTPLAVQALPGFSVSTVNVQSGSSGMPSQNLSNACEKWQHSHGSRSTLSSGGEARFCLNGFHQSFQSEGSASSHLYLQPVSFDNPKLNNCDSSAYEKLEVHGLQKCLTGWQCKDVDIVKDMNLNVAPPNTFQDGFSPQQKGPSHTEGKNESESLLGGLSWLRTKSSCSEPRNINNDAPKNELGVVQGYSQLMLKYPISTQEVNHRKETKDSLSLDMLPLILRAKGSIVQCNEESVTSSSRKIIRFPVSQKTQWSSPDDNVKNMAKENFLNIDSYLCNNLLELEKQIHLEMDLEKGVVKCPNGLMDRINLNSTMKSMDQLRSSESSSKDGVQSDSTHLVQETTRRFVREINLEAPVTSLTEELGQISSAEAAIDNIVSQVQPENRGACLQASEIGDEALVRMAAETVRMMSLDKHIHLQENTLCPSSPALADTFHWFADVVTSNADDLEAARSMGDGDQGSSDIDGMDYFEYMTLKLEEIKVDECSSIPLEIDNPKMEETGVAHLLLTRARRGQGRRRRRQRRDFQRDILPGLASLSRHEVTEDMQIIRGLMRASGQPWQAGGSRRNSCRNQSHSQSRGRGQARGTRAAAMVEIPLDPQPRKRNNEIEIDGGSILGWGRTTRRCWRQKCSSGNILVPFPS